MFGWSIQRMRAVFLMAVAFTLALSLYCFDYQRYTGTATQVEKTNQPKIVKEEPLKVANYLKKPLNLIFHFDMRPVDEGGRIYEVDWIINQIFGNIDRPVRVMEAATVMDLKSYQDSVSVFLFEPPVGLFQRLHNENITNFGALQMGDELFSRPVEFYSEVDFAFRNYFNRDILAKYENSMYVPVGTRSGLFFPHSFVPVPSSRRRYLYSFIGSLRSNRKYALDSVTYGRDQAFIKVNQNWASNAGMKAIHYRNVITESKFVLCPWGNNEESVRFYEALEAGAIPVAQKSQLKTGDFIDDGLGADSPVLRVNDWKEVDDLLRYYEEHPIEMDKLQRRIVEWWSKSKLRIQLDVRKRIDAGFEKHHGKAES
eukprot:Partr_v1_DN26332_c0_g1_i2_m43254